MQSAVCGFFWLRAKPHVWVRVWETNEKLFEPKTVHHFTCVRIQTGDVTLPFRYENSDAHKMGREKNGQKTRPKVVAWQSLKAKQTQ